MKSHIRTNTIARNASTASGFLVGLLIGSFLGSTVVRAADDDLAIARQGNFYIAGKYVESNGDMPMIGQAFVQFQIPQRQTHPYPIVMVHGGGQSGSGWISTPDGRDGWATYFLRHGYAVYVIDQVARGRSAYIADVYGPSRTQTREYSMQRFSTSEKYSLWRKQNSTRSGRATPNRAIRPSTTILRPTFPRWITAELSQR
jgi:pimeloyl-ACP methyl ester carboxylesterase